jgi:hypothetical protein
MNIFGYVEPRFNPSERPKSRADSSRPFVQVPLLAPVIAKESRKLTSLVAMIDP